MQGVVLGCVGESVLGGIYLGKDNKYIITMHSTYTELNNMEHTTPELKGTGISKHLHDDDVK